MSLLLPSVSRSGGIVTIAAALLGAVAYTRQYATRSQTAQRAMSAPPR